MKIKKIPFLVIFIFISLTFLKIDYRFADGIFCCGDDHDYYMHAETIAIDRDLDYSNQFTGIDKVRYKNGTTVAPKGFIGTGLFASPFLFFGNFLDKFDTGSLMNFSLLAYSLSSVIYFFISIYLTLNSLKLLNVKFKSINVFLLFFGSGLSYYAFERFSMTHVYEVFTTCMVINLSIKYYLDKQINKKYLAFSIPFWICLGLMVRWVNYYLLFLPIIIKKIFIENQKVKSLIYEKYFYLGILMSLFLFTVHTELVYGSIIYDPQDVYQNTTVVGQYLVSLENFAFFIKDNLTSFLIILFTKEFGILWFSPVIFFSLITSVMIFYSGIKSKEYESLYILLCYLQVFLIVIMWNSLASSYGFRYLLCLVPLSILIVENFKNQYIGKYFYNLLILLSVFSSLSVLFFETTEETSLRENINSFGSLERFSQPEYLTGYLQAFGNFDSYSKIFVTSFVGAIFFKILIAATGVEGVYNLLSRLGLEINNPDFDLFLIQLTQINIFKFLFVIFIFILLGIYTYTLLQTNSENFNEY